MAIDRRKDSTNRILKEGEYQRSNGSYEFRWRDRHGDRHSVYAKNLQELREKELKIRRDFYDGVNYDTSLTVNDIYYRWKGVKRGLKANTFQNYKYMSKLAALNY